MNESSARHDDAPRESQNTKVHGWALELLEQDVARDFEKHVGNEDWGFDISIWSSLGTMWAMGVLTDGQNSVVLHGRHAQVVHHAFDLGIANVRAVYMSHQVEESKHRHKPNINLGGLLVGAVLAWTWVVVPCGRSFCASPPGNW
jgi:hypothetical protein